MNPQLPDENENDLAQQAIIYYVTYAAPLLALVAWLISTLGE